MFLSVSRGIALVASSLSQLRVRPRLRAIFSTAFISAPWPASILASTSLVVRPRSNAMLIAAPPMT